LGMSAKMLMLLNYVVQMEKLCSELCLHRAV
jgi:hypothetical protein